MLQHIGNAGTKAKAWVEHIKFSATPLRNRGREIAGFTVDRGEPLDVSARSFMEPFFGYNLGGVRIHRGYRAEEASRQLNARAFTFGRHIFAPRQNIDSSTKKGRGLLAHELTHAIQQTQPERVPRIQTADQDTSSAPGASPGSHSNTDMVYLSPAQSTDPQQRETQAQASEQSAARGLTKSRQKETHTINPESVAEKVYRLMQRDLTLELERATRLGG